MVLNNAEAGVSNERQSITGPILPSTPKTNININTNGQLSYKMRV